MYTDDVLTVLTQSHTYLSHRPAHPRVCWQCVWIHVLFISYVSPSCQSDGLWRCAVDTKVHNQSAPNLICTELNSRTHHTAPSSGITAHSLAVQSDRAHHSRLNYDHSVGHTVGNSREIQHHRRSYKRSLTTAFITQPTALWWRDCGVTGRR